MQVACNRTRRFLKKVFTRGEIEYCYRKKNPFPCFSARFAAKEALLKALGVGWGRGIGWTDIEVFNDELGAPGIRFLGSLKEIARKREIKGVMLSLSHSKDYAVAVVILAG